MSAAREEMATSAWELQANKTEINPNLSWINLWSAMRTDNPVIFYQ